MRLVAARPGCILLAAMKLYLNKMRGAGPAPVRLPAKSIVRGFLGALLAIGTVAYLAASSGTPLVLGSFGASCVLLFSFPDNPFSQPRNVIGGHFVSSLAGLLFLAVFGSAWWSTALALASAIALMHVTRTVHPPAGSNPVIIMLTSPTWDFLVRPTLLGAVILVAVALVFNNTAKQTQYPRYWI
jgi:CBS-domain-containing membrane protein